MLVRQSRKDPFNRKIYSNYIRIYYIQNLFNKEKSYFAYYWDKNCHPIPVNIIYRLSNSHPKIHFWGGEMLT